MTRQEGLKLARAGDVVALHAAHDHLVRRLAWKLTKDPDKAADLTQEVWLLVCRKLHLYRGDAAFSTWLYRVTMYRFLMEQRKPQHTWLEVQDVMRTTTMPDVITRLDLDRLATSLPPQQRRVVRALLRTDDLQKDVAARLGMRRTTMVRYLHLAKQTLRKALTT